METLHRLKNTTNIRCTQCRRKRFAKWYLGNEFFCKWCAKSFWRLQNRPKKPKLPRGKHYRSNEKTCTKRIKKLRTNATWAEKIFKGKLKKAIKVKFKFQRAFVKGGYYAIVDFHIPSRNICIEIDGEYHNNSEQKRKDEYRDKWLTEIRGQKVIRLTNEQAKNITITEIKKMVRSEARMLPS